MVWRCAQAVVYVALLLIQLQGPAHAILSTTPPSGGLWVIDLYSCWDTTATPWLPFSTLQQTKTKEVEFRAQDCCTLLSEKNEASHFSTNRERKNHTAVCVRWSSWCCCTKSISFRRTLRYSAYILHSVPLCIFFPFKENREKDLKSKWHMVIAVQYNDQIRSD